VQQRLDSCSGTKSDVDKKDLVDNFLSEVLHGEVESSEGSSSYDRELHGIFFGHVLDWTGFGGVCDRTVHFLDQRVQRPQTPDQDNAHGEYRDAEVNADLRRVLVE